MIPAVIERCAGIDVGKTFLAVSVMVGAADKEPRCYTRECGTTVVELERLRDWLLEHGCTHVAMESTGSYWKPIFNVLEDSMTVVLAHAEQVKARKGHKTDKKDSWWLAHLLRHGMIRPSFIPPRAVRELRDLTRRRKRLIGDATSERNRVEKILQEANVKLSSALSDIFGVSGQLMLEALLDGQANPEQIAQLAQRRAKRKIPEIIAALEGHRFGDHHRKMIRYCLEHLRFLEEQLLDIDAEIAAKIQAEGWTEQWELLEGLPGVGETSAASMLAEIGPEMSPFPSARQFSSWAGACPGNRRSAGKSKSSRPTKGNRWLRATLTECAWAATKKKDCFLKEKYWRFTTKGKSKATAVSAISHTLLLLIYQVLTTKQPYQERGLPPLDETARKRLIRHHIRRLGRLGVNVHYAPCRSRTPRSLPLKE